MKKNIYLFMAAILASVVTFTCVVNAAVVEGTVKSVDAKKMSIVVMQGEKASTVTYSSTTTWPKDVKDPAILKGKKVKVNTDDKTGTVVSVDIVK